MSLFYNAAKHMSLIFVVFLWKMESFQIIQPSVLLAPYVKHYWFLTTGSVSQATERVIPTGMMCLVFHRTERIFSSSADQWQPQAFLGGQETTYTDLCYSGNIDMISVVFQPFGARAFFDMPMITLQEQAVDIDNLSDVQLVELKKRLVSTADRETCVLFIEQFLLKRLCRLAAHNLKRVNAVVQSIYSGQQNISMLAQTACLGYKQFKRIFAEYVGSNPKKYLRVVRFQKALHVLQTRKDVNLTQLTYECGYYDQAHLIKEFKQFSGYTPSEYLSVCAPYSDYFS